MPPRRRGEEAHGHRERAAVRGGEPRCDERAEERLREVCAMVTMNASG